MLERDLRPHQPGAQLDADRTALLRQEIEERLDQVDFVLLVALPGGRHVGAERTGEARRPDEVGFDRHRIGVVVAVGGALEASLAEPAVGPRTLAVRQREARVEQD